MKNMELSFGMQIGNMMHSIFKVLKQRTSEQTEEKLTIEQFGLLHTISEKEEEVILKDMACMLGKDKSAVLRQLDSLEEKGLVRRVPDKNDRRKNFLMITKKGEKVVDTFFEIGKQLTEELREGISPSEIETFYKVVDKIKANADKL
jgi:DNA-binding MarR family transcriptional regulator